jgi:predicted RNA-binding protein
MANIKSILKKVQERNADIATKPYMIRFDLTPDIVRAMIAKQIDTSSNREFDTEEEARDHQFLYELKGLPCRIVKQTIGLPRAL